MTDRNRKRRFDPRVGEFEWPEMPDDDERARALLLVGYPGVEADAAVYREWRELGAGVAASLIRAGEAARGRDGPFFGLCCSICCLRAVTQLAGRVA